MRLGGQTKINGGLTGFNRYEWINGWGVFSVADCFVVNLLEMTY